MGCYGKQGRGPLGGVLCLHDKLDEATKIEVCGRRFSIQRLLLRAQRGLGEGGLPKPIQASLSSQGLLERKGEFGHFFVGNR